MTEEPTGAASFDVAAGAAAIASELGAGGEGGGAPASNSAVTGASPPQSDNTSTPPAPPPAWEALPKAWKKDLEAHWGQLPPEVREYVHQREQQATNGITQYKRGHDNWSATLKPFESVLKEYPDVNVPEILTTLAQNHLRLVRGSPEERVQMARELLQGYGIDMQTLLGGGAAPTGGQPSGQPGTPFTPEQLSWLKQSLGPVFQAANEGRTFAQSQRQEAATKEVDAFFSNAENEFVNDVADDILAIIKAGQAANLPDAYQMAVLRNPEVKAKYLAKLARQAAPPPVTPAFNVKSSPTAPRSPAGATMDDTIDATVKRLYG